jgi:hypothetical protein
MDGQNIEKVQRTGAGGSLKYKRTTQICIKPEEIRP